MQFAAMEKGAARAKRGGVAGDAAFFSAKSRDLRKTLDGLWTCRCTDRSHLLGPNSAGPKGARFLRHPRSGDGQDSTTVRIAYKTNGYC